MACQQNSPICSITIERSQRRNKEKNVNIHNSVQELKQS